VGAENGRRAEEALDRHLAATSGTRQR